LVTTLQFAAICATIPYYHTVNRIRKWGRLPSRRGPTIVLANHQGDLDSPVIVMRLIAERPLREPVLSVAGRRMFEPGFMVKDSPPWLHPFLRRVDASPLFAAIGLQPMENELGSRALSSYAWIVRERHGDMPIEQAFEDSALAKSGLHGIRLSDVLSPQHFAAGKTYVKTREVREPYRSEIARQTRDRVEADLASVEDLVRRGATFHLTPEGRFSRDGKLYRFRATFWRLAPIAAIYLSPIAFDPFRSKRPQMLIRILGPVEAAQARLQLAAARPVVVSQLLAEYLTAHASFSRDDVSHAIAARVRSLPTTLFVDPDLARDPERLVDQSLRELLRLRILVRDGENYRLGPARTAPSFPLADDIVAYQAAFFAETLEADAALRALAAPPPLVGGG